MAALEQLVRTERRESIVCAHAALVFLGSGGNVTYRQCEDCGTLLVTGGDRTWALPRS